MTEFLELKKELVGQIFHIYLRVRLHREWQKASRAGTGDFSERDALLLELIAEDDYAPMTEAKLRRVMGKSPASVSEMVGRLVELKLVRKEKLASGDARQRALSLEQAGRDTLRALKTLEAARYEVLLSRLTDEQLDHLKPIVESMKQAVSDFVTRDVFR